MNDKQIVMPKVLTSDGHKINWETDEIKKSLMKSYETAKQFNPQIKFNEKLAEQISLRVASTISLMNLKEIDSSLIRALVDNVLFEAKLLEMRNKNARVGIPLNDIVGIILGEGDEINANMVGCSETSQKNISDLVCKNAYRLLLPDHLRILHDNADLHIGDFEYFGSRPFCMDWDLRYFFYYGLMPDGKGMKASVAGPAKKAEVAMLHAVKALGSAQTNFAGGQGYYNFLTFIAPYLAGMGYEEIEQLMQMFIYEMTQMMVARGGQLVFSSVQLTPGVPELWKDKPVVCQGQVWDGRKEVMEDGREIKTYKWSFQGKANNMLYFRKIAIQNHKMKLMGKIPSITYGEYEREVRLAFKALMTIMLKGDNWNKPFNFPKPEIAIEPEFIDEATWDKPLISQNPYGSQYEIAPSYKELYQMAFKLTFKYGTPYYDNMIPAYRGHSKGGVSCYQCCAYNFNTDPTKDKDFASKMQFKDKETGKYGAHFSMGAWQTITLNVPRAALIAAREARNAINIQRKLGSPNALDQQNLDWDKVIINRAYDYLITHLKGLMLSACDIHQEKRKWMNKIMAANRMPFITQQPKDPITGEPGVIAIDLDALVSVIGIIGITDVAKIITGYHMHEKKESHDFAIRLVSELKMFCYELTDKYGFKVALARTPAETIAQRFAVADLLNEEIGHDAKWFVHGNLPDALTELARGNRNAPVYWTNGTHTPVDAPISIDEKIKIEEVFFPLVDGGNVLHIFTEEISPFFDGTYKQVDENGNRENDAATDVNAGLLMEWTFKKCRETNVGYIDFTPILTTCNDCAKTTNGNFKVCPFCGSTSIFHLTRITGYFNVLEGFNAAKFQEVNDRIKYRMTEVTKPNR